ncbi:MAG: DUF507 family protein [Candidatus Sumerlaeia bacterium]|nr:DUF507 family protein [Candidatus Sumerlaeia bacterium]
MAGTRIPKERIDFLTNQLVAVLEKNPDFDVTNVNEVRAIFRNTLTADIQAEIDLEKEVLETLRQHGQQIYQENADFEELFRRGKQLLAKKKRIIL